MEHPTQGRIHPLVAGAAASVILVSLVGAAAISGVIPSSHSSVESVAKIVPVQRTEIAGTQIVKPAATQRYVTTDGKVLEVMSSSSDSVTLAKQAPRVQAKRIYDEPKPVRRKPAHHYVQSYQQQQYAQTNYNAPGAYTGPVTHQDYSQPPVQTYISTMNPVGTGVGAVVGGLLGHQVGGGNGKTLATVAGAVLGGYAGNEISHNRSPLPW